MRCTLLNTWKEGASLLLKTRDTEELEQTDLAVSLSLLHLAHLCSITYSQDFSLIIKSSMKTLRFNGFSGSSFAYDSSHVT